MTNFINFEIVLFEAIPKSTFT